MVYMLLLDDDGFHAPFIARLIDWSMEKYLKSTYGRRVMCTLRYILISNTSILLSATVIKLAIFCYIVNLDLSTQSPCLPSEVRTRAYLTI